VTELRDNLSSLEKRAASLQDEISTAEKNGTLKEARIAELMGQLAETKASADKAASHLKSLGFTNSELNDQVGKLQNRLSSSQASLDSASRLIEEQKRTIAEQTQTIATTQAAASAAAAEAERLRQNNADLSRELDSRPKVSMFKEADLYKPSKDRKKK